jgi:hypothetical protein
MNNKKILDNVLKSVFYMMDNESDLTDDDYLEIIDYLKGDLENDKKSIIEKRLKEDRDYKILVNLINYEINRQISPQPFSKIIISLRRAIRAFFKIVTSGVRNFHIPTIEWRIAIPATAIITTVLLFLLIPPDIELNELGTGNYYPVFIGGERGSKKDSSYILPHSIHYDENDETILFKWTQSNPNADKYIIKINEKEFVTTTNQLIEKIMLDEIDTLKIQIAEFVLDNPIIEHKYVYLIKR